MLRSRPGHEISRRGAIEERRNEARRNEGKRCEQPDVPFPSAFALGNLGHAAEPDVVEDRLMAAMDFFNRAPVVHNPSNTGWQRNLSVSFGRAGDVLRAQGDLTAARGLLLETMGDGQLDSSPF
jgi:hypothetical protein